MRRALFILAGLLILRSLPLAAQAIDIVHPGPLPTRVATEAMPPRGELAALPPSSFHDVGSFIGVLEDDGNSFWPGFPANFQAPATFRWTPTGNNTFTVQRVAYSFDDPAGATVLFDGSKRPIVGFLDANYIAPRYALATPFPFAGKQITTLSISTWGAIAFGVADTTQVNYDPTVVSSMFRIPTMAVWYELYYYPAGSRVLAKVKPGSVVITWQNVISRHTATPVTFQAELFNDGTIQTSYQTLPVDHGLVGISTGVDSPARQSANGVAATDLPLYLQAASATFDDYGGILAGVTLKLKAPIPAPDAATNESFRYTLMVNGTATIGIDFAAGRGPSTVILNEKTPPFPNAQIISWGITVNGDTLSFRVPATSLEPYLFGSGTNTWSIESRRFVSGTSVARTVTETLPLAFAARHTLLPATVGSSVEVPPYVFHYMPGVWDSDRIRESIATYIASRVPNADSFRFFPSVYDDGLRHANYAGTYPRQKSVTGVGTIPARTDCDCHYGAEFSALAESLGDETTTDVALTHELGHECAFYADYRNAAGSISGLWRDAGIPCFGGAHPTGGLVNRSMFADDQSGASTISVLGGSLTGTVDVSLPRFGFSPVEMYFMGLAAPAEVTPVTYVQNGTPTRITIDQVISANGARTPGYTPGQLRVFRVPTFIVTRKGETVDPAQVRRLESLIWRWRSRFWRETAGRARANTTTDGHCEITVSSTSPRVGSAAGPNEIAVRTDPGCAWNATTTEPWITITAGLGTGDGTLRYNVATNTSGAPRIGNISIAGETIAVTQVAGRRRATRP